MSGRRPDESQESYILRLEIETELAHYREENEKAHNVLFENLRVHDSAIDTIGKRINNLDESVVGLRSEWMSGLQHLSEQLSGNLKKYFMSLCLAVIVIIIAISLSGK